MEAPGSPDRGIATRWVGMAVAAGFLALAAVVVTDSVRVGRGWGSDGPEAGFYPFYVALLLGGGAASILLREWRGAAGKVFVGASEFRRVLAVLLPCVGYVAALLAIGIYVSSALFLVCFMRFQGKYSWSRALPLGIGVPLALFALFELGFGLPLPKGPLESWFGY
jgi:putative tricarboxylic transport membrane protein